MNSVFLLREMPDWERLKPVPQNDAYRRWFYGRWGRENAVISGTGRNVEYLPFRQRLSIKLARGGRERYFIDGRSIAVDDDSYLILNDNRVYASSFERGVEIESFSIFFRPGIAEEVHGALGVGIERGLAEYRPNPAHRRAKLLACTEAGYWAIRQISIAQHPWADEIGAAVGAEALEQMLATMRALLAALYPTSSGSRSSDVHSRSEPS